MDWQPAGEKSRARWGAELECVMSFEQDTLFDQAVDVRRDLIGVVESNVVVTELQQGVRQRQVGPSVGGGGRQLG